MKSNLINITYALLLISFGYFATDIYLPSLPALSEYFQTGEGTAQMTLFSYMLCFSFTPLFFGPISDNLGRKKIILIGLFTSLIGTFGCFIATSIYGLIFFRCVQGIGAGGVMISTRAIVPDLYRGKALAKQISYITMFMPLILAFAPTLGGYLQEAYNWQAVFLFLLGYILIMMITASFYPESLKEPSGKKISEIFPIYRELLTNRPFVRFGLGMVIPTFGMFAYLTSSPFLFQNVIGLSPSEYGILSLYIGAAIMLTSFLNAKLLHRCSTITLLRVGGGLLITAGILMLTFYLLGLIHTWTILLPAVFYFSCMPFAIANSASTAMTYIDKHFGAASALLATAQFLAGSLGILLFSWIPDTSPLPLAICFLFVGILFTLNLSRAYKESN